MKVFFVRHGEPTYNSVKNLRLISYLGELSPEGEKQAQLVASDPRFSDAELIVSSPFTRALQTAAIISRITYIPLTVEPRLHEWLEDTTHQFTLDEERGKLAYREFYNNNGHRTSSTIFNWEDISHVAQRTYDAIADYYHKGYKCIIVVAHAIVIRTFGYKEQSLKPCTIFEKEFDENTKFEGFVPWKG